MAEDLGDKTEAPSPRRRTEARDRGQVAKSPELSAGLDLVGAFVLILTMGTALTGGFAAILRALLDSRVSGSGINLQEVQHAAWWTLGRVGVLTFPFFAVMFVIVLFAQVLQVGFHPTLEPLMPKLDRLNPIAGIGRLFATRNTVKAAISTLKLVVVLTMVVMLVRGEWSAISALAGLDVRPGLVAMLGIITRICAWLIAILLIFGIADFAYQRWQQTQDLKMTKQEVKEELKSMEGDQSLKGKRLRFARQIALQRLKQSVPKADVIVTNPTHFAVALQYDQNAMAAPRVVAKGADAMAFRIREIALANKVAIVERPPLARALYFGVPVGKPISQEHFEAVAEILAYVYRLNGKAA